MAARRIELALDGDQMFLKAVAEAARDLHEVQFEAMDRPYIGFTSGMDEEWIRITETDEEVKRNRLRRILIKRRSVIAMSETGRTVADLGPKEAERVRAYTGVFRKAAQREIEAAALPR